ncbi:MAG TPA: hypothetical protein VGC42_22085 [Kofleriaceae bacterium]
MADVRVEGRISYDRGRDHYDRFEPGRWGNSRWVEIAHGNGNDGRREFMLGNGNTFRKVRIEATRGEPAIEKIAIDFGTGTNQVIQMNSTLTGNGGDIIDLQGDRRRVIRVIVYPMPHSRGSYSVFGG